MPDMLEKVKADRIQLSLDNANNDINNIYFYVRVVNQNKYALVEEAEVKNLGDHVVVHMYGDGAAVFYVSSIIKPREIKQACDFFVQLLNDREMKELEIVDFRGNKAMLGSLVLALMQNQITVVENEVMKESLKLAEERLGVINRIKDGIQNGHFGLSLTDKLRQQS